MTTHTSTAGAFQACMARFRVSPLMQALLERRSCRDLAPLICDTADIDRFYTLPFPARLNPLACAILTGQPAQTELLLRHGASMNALDMQWNTPLHLACLAREPGIVDLLLDCRAPLLVRNASHKLPAELLHGSFGRGDPAWDAQD